MRLFDAIRDLDKLNDKGIICARPPWRPDAECEIVTPNESLRVPEQVQKAGLKYFLEVHVAKETLEAFGQRKPTLEQRFELLVYYAEHDAFPDWV